MLYVYMYIGSLALILSVIECIRDIPGHVCSFFILSTCTC